MSKELNKHGRADVGKRNHSPIYHRGTVRCQDVPGDHGGIVKGTTSRQHICLCSLTFEQGQVGRAAAFSRIRRFKSSLLNPSWVFFLDKPVKTHSWQSHPALYTRARAFVRRSQSFLRICRSHFRKDPHFMGFFLNLRMRPIQRAYPLLATDNNKDKRWSVVLAITGELLLFLLLSSKIGSAHTEKVFATCSKENGCSPPLLFSWKCNLLLSPAGAVITVGQAFSSFTETWVSTQVCVKGSGREMLGAAVRRNVPIFS